MNETIQETPDYDMAEAQEMALRQRSLSVRESCEPTNMLAVIDRAARDPNVNVDKMERLLALSEQIHARQAKSAYDQAMNDAQTEMRPVSRDCHNPQTRSRYASYEAIDNAIRPIYTRHGFAMSFGSKAGQPDRVIVTCRISHRMGHTEHVELEMPADGKGAKGGDVMTKTHATGSALSYGKRYITNLVWNLSFGESDDDGNAAGGRKTQNRTTETPVDTGTRQKATAEQIAPKSPKVATEATRKWLLDNISPLPNAIDYAKARGFASLEEWPLDQVPTSRQGLEAIIREINAFKPAPPSTEEMPPDEIGNVVIHIPPAGVKLKEYNATDRDTIGSLYRKTKEGDATARTRFWGFVGNFEATGYNGQPPSQADLVLRAGLDAFEKWYEQKKLRQQSAPDPGPSMGEMTSFDYRDTDP